MRLLRDLALGSVLVLGIAGCSGGSKTASGDAEAEKFLKWSMNQYAGLKSYTATESWKMIADGKEDGDQKRELVYSSPNKFRVAMAAPGGLSVSTVSDGAHLVEIAKVEGGGVTKYEAPASIAAADDMQMKHPLYNGTLLYQFFGGSDNFDGLVDRSKGPVTFGPDEKAPNGEDARLVKFYGAEQYGHTAALIGKKTGQVYRLTYDNEPARQKMADSPEAQQLKGKIPEINMIETFDDIKTNVECAATAFDTTPPKGMPVRTDPSQGNPPVPIGKPAPDMELTGLDGKKVKLSALRGKVVMLDFWATWCGPCKESLPITNKISNEYRAKGLQVFAVSTEDKATVEAFVKENKYTFDAMLDVNAAASKTFNVDGIPCVVIIDPKGNLSSYTIGLEPEAKLMANLKKAGLKL